MVFSLNSCKDLIDFTYIQHSDVHWFSQSWFSPLNFYILSYTYLRSWSHGVETLSDSLPAFFPVNLHGLTARNIVRPEALAQWRRNTTKHDETAQETKETARPIDPETAQHPARPSSSWGLARKWASPARKFWRRLHIAPKCPCSQYFFAMLLIRLSKSLPVSVFFQHDGFFPWLKRGPPLKQECKESPSKELDFSRTWVPEIL